MEAWNLENVKARLVSNSKVVPDKESTLLSKGKCFYSKDSGKHRGIKDSELKP